MQTRKWVLSAILLSIFLVTGLIGAVSESRGSDSESSDLLSPAATSITVTSPNGGEIWQPGSAHVIMWKYAGTPGSYVKVQLYKGTALKLTLKTKTSIGAKGTGSLGWVIPAAFTAGTNYKIKVTSTSNSAYNDLSNANFSIKPKADLVYISPGAKNHVIAFSASAGQVTIPLPGNAYDMTFNSPGTRAYVSQPGSTLVSVINTATYQPIANITLQAQSYPWGLAFKPNTSTLYAVNQNYGTVSVLNTSTNKEVLPRIPITGYSHTWTAINPTGTRLYVLDYECVRVLDTAARKVINSIMIRDTSILLTSLALNPMGTRLYVANAAYGSNIKVINTAINSILSAIPVSGYPSSLAVNPAGTRIYVACRDDDTIKIFDPATKALKNTIYLDIDSEPLRIALNPSGTRLYVMCDDWEGTVLTINTATRAVISTFKTNEYPSDYEAKIMVRP